jgi:hypothetical protein
MFEPFKATCQRVRRNNGVIDALFSSPEDPADPHSQEWHVLINVVTHVSAYEQGRDYWITIEPAFPHKG